MHEELQSHGLEGNVAQADEKTIVVVVEGDMDRIRRLYVDLQEALPGDIKLSDLEISKSKQPLKAVEDPSSQILDLILKLEQRVIRIENKVNAILARTEAGGFSAQEEEEYGGFGADESTEESASAFASMFGD